MGGSILCYSVLSFKCISTNSFLCLAIIHQMEKFFSFDKVKSSISHYVLSETKMQFPFLTLKAESSHFNGQQW